MSIDKIKEIRNRTDLALKDCQKAWNETQDVEKAIEWLRTQGLTKAAKLDGREATQGLVAFAEDNNGASLALLSCETDFVAKTEDFRNTALGVAKACLEQKTTDKTAEVMQEAVTALKAKLGENMEVKETFYTEKASDESVVVYIHNVQADNLGLQAAMIKFKGSDKESAQQIAMHITAMKPKYLTPESVPADFIQKEEDIMREKMKNENKPADIMEKIIAGSIQKVIDEIVLLKQRFFMNEDQTIEEFAKSKGLEITYFARCSVNA